MQNNIAKKCVSMLSKIKLSWFFCKKNKNNAMQLKGREADLKQNNVGNNIIRINW